jgi:carbon-monoxide dehydrogenase iron sulfur subunit
MAVSEQTANERKYVVADIEKCTGCGACELVCALEKEKLFDPRCSRIKILRLHQIVNIPVTCRLCKDAPCVIACSRDALKQSEETGVIMVDNDKCDGCSWCIEACPFGAMMMHPEKKVVSTCDTCKDLGEPQCVKWCPEEALDFVTADVLAQKSRQTAVKKLLEATEKTAQK